MKIVIVNKFILALLKHKIPPKMIAKLPLEFKRCVVVSAANDLFQKHMRASDIQSLLRCKSLDSKYLKSMLEDFKAEDVWPVETIKNVTNELGKKGKADIYNIVNDMMTSLPSYLQYDASIEENDISHILPS